MGIGQAGIGRRGIGQLGIGDRGIPSTPDFYAITVDTTNTGSASDTMIIPLVSGQSYDFEIDWGDGTVETFTSSALTNVTHDTYPAGGVFDIKITGAFPQIRFNNGGDRLKLLDITNWGNTVWTSMNAAFFGCSNLVVSATDVPNLSSVTDISSVFRNCSTLTGDLSAWGVSNVTNFGSAFNGASVFTSDLSSWDVSAGTNMNGMFLSASLFISDLSSWDVSAVTDFTNMLRSCPLFTSDLSSWTVTSGTSMNNMFLSSSLFDSDLSSWRVDLVTTMTNMLLNANLSTANYDLLLNGWSLLTLQSAVPFSVGSTNYTIATSQAARDILTGVPNSWTITDGGGV